MQRGRLGRRSTLGLLNVAGSDASSTDPDSHDSAAFSRTYSLNVGLLDPFTLAVGVAHVQRDHPTFSTNLTDVCHFEAPHERKLRGYTTRRLPMQPKGVTRSISTPPDTNPSGGTERGHNVVEDLGTTSEGVGRDALVVTVK